MCTGFLGKLGLFETISRLLGRRAKQAKYGKEGCFAALIIRAILGLTTVKALVAYVADTDVSRQLGFTATLTFANPIADLLKEFTVNIAQTLLDVTLRSVLAFAGIAAGEGLVLIDSTFLVVYGQKYEKASKGYSSLHKKTMLGYRLQIAYDLKTRLPLAVYLTTGRSSDQTSLATLVQRLARFLGDKRPTLVLDRGYFAIPRCKYLHGRHFSFVIRAKTNANWIKSALAGAHRKGYNKRTAKYKSSSQEVTVPDSKIRVKLVVIRHRDFKKPLLLVTSHLEWTDAQVYRVYLKRMYIEAFFRELRQCWNLNHFVGTNWSQVVGHVYVTLVGYIVHQGIRRSQARIRRKKNILYYRAYVYDIEITAEILAMPLQKLRRELPDLVAVVLVVFSGIEMSESPPLEHLYEPCTMETSLQDVA